MITLERSENRNLRVSEAVRRRKQKSENHTAQYCRHEKLFRPGTALIPLPCSIPVGTAPVDAARRVAGGPWCPTWGISPPDRWRPARCEVPPEARPYIGADGPYQLRNFRSCATHDELNRPKCSTGEIRQLNISIGAVRRE